MKIKKRDFLYDEKDKDGLYDELYDRQTIKLSWLADVFWLNSVINKTSFWHEVLAIHSLLDF